MSMFKSSASVPPDVSQQALRPDTADDGDAASPDGPVIMDGMTEPSGWIGDSAASAALQSLVSRLFLARVLREHHVWEAARIVPFLHAGCPDIKHSVPFRLLMANDRLTQAVQFIAAACHPVRTLAQVKQEPAAQVYLVRCDRFGADRRRRSFRARHADMGAAMLIALFRSLPGNPWRRDA